MVGSMNCSDIKISVGMPVYNGEAYLESSIKSVLNQSFADFEFIISDNASTDRTREICLDFAGQDSRIVYYRNKKNVGAALNYNLCFKRSSGIYFRWFNADDLSSEKLHQRCLDVLENNPDASMCYGKTDIIDAQGNLIEHYDDQLYLQQQSPYERLVEFFRAAGLTNAIYGLLRRTALEKTMLMGDGSFPAADTNMMAELALQGKIIEIPETLFYRRMHEAASSWDRKSKAVQQEFWKGTHDRFVMPTWKQNYSFFRAVRYTPTNKIEKLKIGMHIIRRMIWSRDAIKEEIVTELKKIILH